jgi:acyl dehydratase
VTTLTLADAEATLSQHIGTTGALVTRKIEAGAVQRFVEAIGDPNPMFVDREYAQGTRWHGVVAPPTFLCTVFAPLDLPEVKYGTMGLNGGNIFDYFRPVRIGDVIAAQASLVSVRGVEGRTGGMLISVRETRYTNQDNELVATLRTTGIQR